MNRPTENATPLSQPDLWNGGYLEAAIVLGDRTDSGADERLASALRTAWTSEFMFGPHMERHGFGPESEPLKVTSIDLTERLYGWVQLPSGEWSVGGTLVIREESGATNFDWLDVFLPLGGLSAVDRRVGGYPFGDTSGCRDWLEPLSARLAEIARPVVDGSHATVAFIGFEAWGTPEIEEWDGTVPTERSFGYVVPQAETVATYHAPTEWR